MTPAAWHRRGQILRAHGHDIFVVDTGAPSSDAPALFLLHGFPTSSFDWHLLLPLLQESFRCVALDLLGFGVSAKPRPHAYTIAEQADIVEAVADALELPVFHVIAHGYGDTVAQELLARDFDRIDQRRVRSACLLNGGLFPETGRPPLLQRVLRAPLGPMVAQWMPSWAFERSLARLFGADTQPTPTLLRDLWQLVDAGAGAEVLAALSAHHEEREVNQDRWLLALIQSYSPLLIVNGSADPVSGSPMVARFRDFVDHGEVVELADIGHYPHLEAPRMVARAHRTWMNELLGDRPTEHWDLLVRGAMVYDGRGSPPAVQDVAVRVGKVVAMRPGLDRRRADAVVDAGGHWLLPGLVDLGSQLGTAPAEQTLREALRCGCTTVASTPRVWAGARESWRSLEQLSTLAQRAPLVPLSGLFDAVGHGPHAPAARLDEIRRAMRRGYAGVYADVRLPRRERRAIARAVARFGRVFLQPQDVLHTEPTAVLHQLRTALLGPDRENQVAKVVHALSGQRARQLGLDRGVLELDAPADLVLVDPQALLRSVAAQPVRHVWRAGVRVVHRGALVGCDRVGRGAMLTAA